MDYKFNLSTNVMLSVGYFALFGAFWIAFELFCLRDISVQFFLGKLHFTSSRNYILSPQVWG